MVVSFSLPTARDFYNWQDKSGQDTIGTMFYLMFGMTMYPIPFIFLMRFSKRFKAFMDYVLNRKLVIGAGMAVLFTCLLLTALHIPGWWWTWMTFGVQIAIVVLAVTLLRGRASNAESFIIGVGLMGISIGLWEIPYQVGLKLMHEYKLYDHDYIMRNMLREILIEIPFILGGIYIMLIYGKWLKIVNFNKWFFLFITGCIALYTTWFLTGLWVEINWVVVDDKWVWVQNPLNLTAKTIYRASKVALALGLVALLLPKGGNDERIPDNTAMDSR